MKTKEGVIKEAWGDYWGSFKDRINENGWYDYRGLYFEAERRNYWQFEPLDLEEHPNYSWVRPVSLKGLEGNNGWIRIEKVKDLPKGVGECFVIDSVGKIEIVHYRYLRNSIAEGWAYTHYQPIVKPSKPIY